MINLSAYFDETGHSADQRQKFVGMAGLIAPASNWKRFEEKWMEALRLPFVDLPHFHMKDFANREKEYADWSEERRRKVLGKLLTVIEVAMPYPIGCIVSMERYRKLSQEHKDYFIDPYYMCYQSSIEGCVTFLESAKAPDEEKIEMIFSDQVEFRHKALTLYEHIVQRRTLHAKRGTPPRFGDMRKLAALQAADLIAYERYKEIDRKTYRSD